MDKKQKDQIIKEETSRVEHMDDMSLMLNYTRMKVMNQSAPTDDDRDITLAIMNKITVVMKQRGLEFKSAEVMMGNPGNVVRIDGNAPRPKPAKYNPKNIVKKKATMPKDILKKVKGKNTLHFHDLMNLNEARVAKEGELV